MGIAQSSTAFSSNLKSPRTGETAAGGGKSAGAAHSAEASHHVVHAASLHFFHDLLHLFVLLQYSIHVLNLGALTLGYSAFT